MIPRKGRECWRVVSVSRDETEFEQMKLLGIVSTPGVLSKQRQVAMGLSGAGPCYYSDGAFLMAAW